MQGTLYIVPTPVGNLEDLAPRSIEILRNVQVILSEDTRTTSVLCKRFDIKTPLRSHHMHNEHATVSAVVDLLSNGIDVALVSDAGTPGISDPGFMLSRACREKGLDVVTIPGPTAFVPALVDSGLPCDRFVFEGFLPAKKGRASRLQQLAADERTFVIYESPLRLVKTLQQLAEVCGHDRPASVSREISKVHEETVRGTLAEIIDHFSESAPKGEIVVVVGGASQSKIKKIHVNKYKHSDVTSQ